MRLNPKGIKFMKKYPAVLIFIFTSIIFLYIFLNNVEATGGYPGCQNVTTKAPVMYTFCEESVPTVDLHCYSAELSNTLQRARCDTPQSIGSISPSYVCQYATPEKRYCHIISTYGCSYCSVGEPVVYTPPPTSTPIPTLPFTTNPNLPARSTPTVQPAIPQNNQPQAPVNYNCQEDPISAGSGLQINSLKCVTPVPGAVQGILQESLLSKFVNFLTRLFN